MGRQFSYGRCPQSPTEMPNEPSRPRWKLWLWATACCFAVTLLLFFLFLGLFVDRAVKLHECESQQWNHTSSAEGRMTGQQAKAESDALRAQLAAVNQSLANIRKDWDSCQKELKLSGENTSVLEDDIQKKEEALKSLDGEKTRLQKQLTQLNNNQETCKRQREEKDKTIQHLKDQLNTRQTSSGVVLFGGPIPPSLLLLVPGFLCSLL